MFKSKNPGGKKPTGYDVGCYQSLFDFQYFGALADAVLGGFDEIDSAGEFLIRFPIDGAVWRGVDFSHQLTAEIENAEIDLGFGIGIEAEIQVFGKGNRIGMELDTRICRKAGIVVGA